MTERPLTGLVRACRSLLALAPISLALVPTLLASPALAQQTLVVGNDRGGYVAQRAQEIRDLDTRNTRIEIRGAICYSSCTMYLGARDVCVTPTTRFGFHGPSRFGRPLPQSQFEHFSNVMARHYTPPLRSWFMSEARYSITTPTEISGAELIRIGYRSC